jgi:hypothetical protein
MRAISESFDKSLLPPLTDILTEKALQEVSKLTSSASPNCLVQGLIFYNDTIY